MATLTDGLAERVPAAAGPEDGNQTNRRSGLEDANPNRRWEPNDGNGPTGDG
ncbi:MAG: hypothetical protein AB4426_07130 [Xenococcaceae cyanobacterium]